jgi:hypothetical protein
VRVEAKAVEVLKEAKEVGVLGKLRLSHRRL